MTYSLLADGVILIHLAWILFVCCGLLIAFNRPWLAWIHGTALVFALVLNLMGWYCPLTHLENYLMGLESPHTAYGGSFVAHHILPLIYPDLDPKSLRTGAVLFVGLNLACYGVLCHRMRRQKRRPQDP